jgi:hypothetical protein
VHSSPSSRRSHERVFRGSAANKLTLYSTLTASAFELQRHRQQVARSGLIQQLHSSSAMAAADSGDTLARVARTFYQLPKVDSEDLGGQQQPDISDGRAKQQTPKEKRGNEGRDTYEGEVEALLQFRLRAANQERLLDTPRRGELIYSSAGYPKQQQQQQKLMFCLCSDSCRQSCRSTTGRMQHAVAWDGFMMPRFAICKVLCILCFQGPVGPNACDGITHQPKAVCRQQEAHIAEVTLASAVWCWHFGHDL